MMNVQMLPTEPAELPDNGCGGRAYVFGGGMVGMITHPPSLPCQRTGVILFNAGLVHRVGPFRSYVQLARALAAQGYPVLRYDQPGLGDSPASALTSSHERRRVELDAAMQLLSEETGVDRFVVGGICSAADDAFVLAHNEPRVAGMILLDGLAYRTFGFWLHHLAPRVLDLRRWLRLGHRKGGQPPPDAYRDFPERTEAARQLAVLVARDVRMLFVYTGGAYRLFNHPRQLAASLGKAARAPQVALHHWPDCDHTFYLRQHRQRLQHTVLAWMQHCFATTGIQK